MKSSITSLKDFKPYMLSIVSFLIIIVSVIFMIFGVRQIMDLQVQINSKETLRNAYDRKIEVLTNQTVSKLDKDLTNSLLALPASYDSPTLLNSLEKIATASGVTFSGLQFSQAAVANTTSESLGQNTFSLSTSSDYAHIIAMLRNFENTLPLFTINNISLRNGSAGDNTLSFSFGITTYYQGLPMTIGAKNSVIENISEQESQIMTELENYSKYPLVPDTSGIGRDNPFR